MSNPLLREQRSNGFTLVELMVALVVGLIIVFAVVTMFVTMLRSTSDNLKFVRLNQDMRSAMALITRDIRRAGANQNSANDAAANPPVSNPFAGVTILPNQQGDDEACIVYSYNSGEANELYGFRWNSAAGTVEDRGATGAACDAGGWQTLSDAALLNVTGLSFTEDPLRSPATLGNVTIREITVTLAAALRRDPAVFREISETIKIRNEEF